MKKISPTGFTLIELLIVVSVIAILSTLGVAVFTSAQGQARDARRKADIQTIQKSLESHYNDSTCGATATASYCAVTAATEATLFANGSIPVNPSPGGAAYTYPGLNVSSYTICAQLENSTGNYANAGITPNATNTGTYYCLKNLQ